MMTPGSKIIFLLAISPLIGNLFARNPIRWDRLLAFLALAAAITVPYLCLPDHVFPYYAFNWTVWEAGGGLLALWKLWPGIRSGAAIGLLTAVL